MNRVHDISLNAIYERLDLRYPSSEWFTFRELRSASGFDSERTIDFYALHRWPSKGFWRVAIEIKRSVRDFRRELDKWEKRKPWVEASNEFWIAAPRGVVPVAEVPEECGLLEITEKQCRMTKRAPQRQIADKTIHLTNACAMLRNACKSAEDARRKLESIRAEFGEFEGRTITVDDLRERARAENEQWQDYVKKRERAEARRELDEEARQALNSLEDFEVNQQRVEELRELLGTRAGASTRYVLSDAVNFLRRIAGMLEAQREAEARP